MRVLAFSTVLFTTLTLVASGARAQGIAPIDTLFRDLGLPQIIEIMRKEGIGYGEELQDDLLGGRGGGDWLTAVEAIYNLEQMQQTVRNRLDRELAAEDLAPMLTFFASDRGRQIVSLEVSARLALLDDGVDTASRDALAAMIADEDPRLELIEDFSDTGDLVENNVVGALNSNYAFYSGLAEGGAFEDAMTEDQILSDVWSQEAAIRVDTQEWLYSYLALAYQPLSDEDLQIYTAFFMTDAGTVLNRAIFAAFDEMFVSISHALGLEASRFLAGQEL